jgi:basic amino acid/polyamine antiporter, APA family
MTVRGKFSSATAVAIVIANMIGTGVFTSLGFQLIDIRSGFVIMLLWALGGGVAFCGALCYAELGARLPRSGGEYNFLGQTYHPAAGFISGWVSVTVGFAAPTALAAITFGTYLSSVFPSLDPLLLATVLILSMTAIHATTHKNSAGLQGFFTAAKILLIVGFSIAALLSADALQTVRYAPDASDIPIITSGAFAVSLLYVGYAYSGWNAATYLTGELKNPAKSLPRILLFGTGVVMVSYLLLNYVFMAVAPMDAMAGELEIGYIAATHAFGEIGAAVMGVTLALLLISTVSAMLVAAPRVLQVLGEDYSLFKFLGKRNRHQIPATAIWFQSIMALIFLWSASFQSILIFSGTTMALNSLFAVFGIFILRHNEKREFAQNGKEKIKHSFNIPFFPIPPIIFMSITAWTLVYLTLENPTEIIFGVCVIVTGAIGYMFTRKFSGGAIYKVQTEKKL